MKLTISVATCILILRVECQSQFGQNQQYNEQYTGSSRAVYPAVNAQNISPYFNNTASIDNIQSSQNLQFAQNTQEMLKVPDYDSYAASITRNDNRFQQYPNQGAQRSDDRIYFVEPNEGLHPPPFAENSAPNYYSAQHNDAGSPAIEPESSDSPNQNVNPESNAISNIVTNAVSNFGLRLIQVASEVKPGNIIVSPTSITTALALLQQGATGESQDQITKALNMSPDASKSIFSVIATNVTRRNSRNTLSIANSIFVSDAFDLNNTFRTLAIQNFWSEISATDFSKPLEAISKINTWVARKTNDKITNLLFPGAVSQNTQLVLLNAVYFKGIWETKFKPEKTQTQTFHLSNGEKKSVPFMNTRHAFQVGYDPNTRALVTLLPFEGNQYSLILILPKKSDNAANVLSTLTTEQLLQYQSFSKLEIAVQIPKFTLKTDTDLNIVLRNMGVTNIFGTRSELTGIGVYRTHTPQISRAVHSGYLSIDEQGVTAAAATAFVAIALSFDDSSITFRADRPFIAVLWDKQLSIPIFISKIEDPS